MQKTTKSGKLFHGTVYATLACFFLNSLFICIQIIVKGNYYLIIHYIANENLYV